MKRQLPLAILAIFLTSLTAYGQNVRDHFTRNGRQFKITSKNPNTVEVVGLSKGTNLSELFGFPTLIIRTHAQPVDQNESYAITAIGSNAFDGRNTDKLVRVYSLANDLDAQPPTVSRVLLM